MHVVTALNYGIPPRKINTRRSFANRVSLKDEQLDRYADELLAFREWCEANDLNFRASVVLAIKRFQRVNS